MAKPAYRKASEWTGWWLGIVLLGVAAQIGTLFFLSSSGLTDRMGAWVFLPGVMPTLIAMLIGWRLLARFNRQRLRLLAQRLEALGFQMTVNPDEMAKTEFAAPIIHLFPTLELQHGAARLRWFAAQTSGPVRALLFEHEYVTGSGKFTQVHHHTIVAWPAGHAEIGDAALATGLWFLMARYPLLVRRVKEKGALKDPAFADLADRWTLHGNPATGARFLTPRVREEIGRSPMGEEWCLGSGWICCSFKGTLETRSIEAFLAHARKILGK